MSPGWILFLILVCILASGYFSGAETALLSVDRVGLKGSLEKGDTRAALAWSLLQAPEDLFTAILLAVNVANVAATALATTLFVDLGIRGAESAATLVMVPVVLLFAEILPKALGRRIPESYTLRSARMLDLTRLFLSPILSLVDGVTLVLMRLIGVSQEGREASWTREEIKLFIEGQASDSATDRAMLRGAWNFARTTLREVMIPLTRVVSISEDASFQEAEALARRHGFARLPVIRDRVDNVVGLLDLGELAFEVGLRPDSRVRTLCRRPLYLPNTLASEKAILAMQRSRETMAIVIDEYGGCDGIVLMKDMFEEVVGELERPLEARSELIRTGPQSFLAQGEIDMDRLNDEFDWQLPKDGFETLAGFLMTRLENIPQAGDRLETDEASFEVLEVRQRTATRVQIRLKSSNSV